MLPFQICIFFVEKEKDWLLYLKCMALEAKWLSGRVLDSRTKGHGLKPQWRYCVVSLSKNITFSLVLVQPRKPVPL